MTLVAATLAAIANSAWAADDPRSFNASVITDYRYRSISQNRLKPALQDGLDAVSPRGWYAGS